MAPPARNRSTRRLAADAVSPTRAPMSAKLRRASSTSSVMMFSSTGSRRTPLISPSGPTRGGMAQRTGSSAVPAGPFRVDSEVGRLRQVILHRPGTEMLRLTPGNKDRLLFDDVLWVHRAQQEHDRFAEVLREQGVTVHLFADLLRNTLEVPEARRHVLDKIFDERVYGPIALHALRNAFDAFHQATLPGPL